MSEAPPARPPWATDRGELDAARVRAALGEALPSLRTDELRFLGAGFDHDAWQVGAELVFRFPRRADVLAFQVAEESALTRIAGRLPVAVPDVVHRCRPVAAFPHPFLGCRLVPGIPGDAAALDPHALPSLAAQLAATLRALHAVDAAGLAVPDVGDRIAANAHAAQSLAERFRSVAPPDLVAVAEPLLTGAEPLPAPAPERRLIHADLAGEHVFVDPARGVATGIVDWSDVAVGDPALDFAGLWLWLGESFARSAIAAYAPIDPAAFAARVRFQARAIGVIEAARPEGTGGDAAFARARRAFGLPHPRVD